MNVIYLDVLIFTNFIISISFLLLTKKLTHTYSSTFFTVLASIIGSLSSLVIFVENSFLAFVIKAFILILQISICFKTLKIRNIISLAIIYLILNISYCGLCILLWNLLDRRLFYIKNLTVYFDIDVGMLIGVTIGIYVIMSVYEYITSTKFDRYKKYTVEIEISGEKYSFSGLLDSGNSLVDYYYSKPVVVVLSDILYEKLNINHEGNVIKNKLHILPYSTVNGEGYIYVTKPLKVSVLYDNNSKVCDVCVGISKQNNQKEKCIFNPKILI